MTKLQLYTRLEDNSAAKVILEKSWVHNNFIKSKKNSEITLFSGEQIKVNKCRTKSGKMLHIALCIAVKYIHETQVNIFIIYIYIYIYIYISNIKTFILNV